MRVIFLQIVVHHNKTLEGVDTNGTGKANVLCGSSEW